MASASRSYNSGGLQSIAGVTQTNNDYVSWAVWKESYLVPFLGAIGGDYTVPSMDGTDIPIKGAGLVVIPRYGDKVAGERLFDFTVLGFLPYITWFGDQVARSKGKAHQKQLKNTAFIPLGKYTMCDDTIIVPPHWEASQVYNKSGTNGMYMSDHSRFYVDICLARSLLFQMSDPAVDAEKLKTLCLAFYSLIQTVQSFAQHRPVYKSKIQQLALSTSHPDVLQQFAASLIQADLNASHCGAITAIRRIINRALRNARRSRRSKKAILDGLFLADSERALRMIAIMSILDLDFAFTPGTGVALATPAKILKKMTALEKVLNDQRTLNRGKNYFFGANIAILKTIFHETTLGQHLELKMDSGKREEDEDDGFSYAKAAKKKSESTQSKTRFTCWVKDVMNPEISENKVLSKYDIEDRGTLPPGVEMYLKGKDSYKPLNVSKPVGGWRRIAPSRANGGGFVIPRPKSNDIMYRVIFRNLETQGTRETRGDTRGTHAGALIRVQTSKSDESISTAGVASKKADAAGAGEGAGQKEYSHGQHLTNDTFCLQVTKAGIVVQQKQGSMTVSWTPDKLTDDDKAIVFFQNMEAEVYFQRLTRKK